VRVGGGEVYRMDKEWDEDRAHELAGVETEGGEGGFEPRGAVISDLDLPGGPLRVVGVHLGLIRASRRRQLTALLETLAGLDSRPTVIAGDFNEWSLTVGLGRMARHFTIHAPGKSFHSRSPVAALDRIALDDRLVFCAAGVATDPLSRMASDHLPIWMDIEQRA